VIRKICEKKLDVFSTWVSVKSYSSDAADAALNRSCRTDTLSSRAPANSLHYKKLARINDKFYRKSHDGSNLLASHYHTRAQRCFNSGCLNMFIFGSYDFLEFVFSMKCVLVSGRLLFKMSLEVDAVCQAFNTYIFLNDHFVMNLRRTQLWPELTG
jgi:hypothetical protein